MKISMAEQKPQVPPMEDPPLPDSYEPSPGEIPEIPDPVKEEPKEKTS